MASGAGAVLEAATAYPDLRGATADLQHIDAAATALTPGIALSEFSSARRRDRGRYAFKKMVKLVACYLGPSGRDC